MRGEQNSAALSGPVGLMTLTPDSFGFASVTRGYATLPPSGAIRIRTQSKISFGRRSRAVLTDAQKLKLDDGREYAIAGISLTDRPELAEPMKQAFDLLLFHGVEVVEESPDHNGAVFRCETPAMHNCGNDPVEKHYEQQLLNEMLLMLGLAKVSATEGLSAGIKNEFDLAQGYAQYQGGGNMVKTA